MLLTDLNNEKLQGKKWSLANSVKELEEVQYMKLFLTFCITDICFKTVA